MPISMKQWLSMALHQHTKQRWSLTKQERLWSIVAFGLATQYLTQRPDKLIFVDEVGSNTCTTKDGHVGGEKSL